jgi:hypothetical protein
MEDWSEDSGANGTIGLDGAKRVLPRTTEVIRDRASADSVTKIARCGARSCFEGSISVKCLWLSVA